MTIIILRRTSLIQIPDILFFRSLILTDIRFSCSPSLFALHHPILHHSHFITAQ